MNSDPPISAFRTSPADGLSVVGACASPNPDCCDAVYPLFLRSSFREVGKIKHTNHVRITGLALDQLKLIHAAFRGDVIPKDSPQAFQTINSRVRSQLRPMSIPANSTQSRRVKRTAALISFLLAVASPAPAQNESCDIVVYGGTSGGIIAGLQARAMG